MPLNLINDPWIPVIQNNQRTNIRPYQICERDVEQLCWPRPDFNLACLEFLIGLVFLTDPVRDERDWNNRYQKPDKDRLQKSLDPFAEYFEMTGDGPRFLQDLKQLEIGINKSNIKTPEMLFIDSAGENTKKDNLDLMVHRDRYGKLSLPFAAMALYTLQAFAPGGGQGHRASMRGGGPMVTILQPIGEKEHLLWRTIWLNVPEGEPLPANKASGVLPWLRPTRTSEKEQAVTQETSHNAEMFFGMPRRLRLIEEENKIVGCVQKNYGTKYENWHHYLSPYYRKEQGSEPLPIHPKPGKVSYQNWLGVTIQQEMNNKQMVARTVHRYHHSSNPPSQEVKLLVGGWAMKKMTPVDFCVHEYPTFGANSEDVEIRIGNLVESANKSVSSLASTLKKSVKIHGGMIDRVKDDFFSKTENGFVKAVSSIVGEQDNKSIPEKEWLNLLRNNVLKIFDDIALGSMSEMPLREIEEIVNQKKNLIHFFSNPNKILKTLDLETREKEVE